MNNQIHKKLYRSPNDRKLTGLLGGIAAYFGWDSTWVRLIYTAFVILTAVGPGILLYLIASFIVPNEPPRKEIRAEEYDH